MAFVDLTDVECQLAEPGMPDFGVLQKPVLGGPINKVDRLGGGHTLSYTVPPKMMESDGRRLVARCQMAKRYGVVLEVPQIRRWATALGAHVTYVAVPGARHDVVLSRPEARRRAYAELERWHRAYVGETPHPG